MTFEEKKKKFEKLLKAHDWYYQRSDDYNAYKRGAKSYEVIWKILKGPDGDKLRPLFDEYWEKHR